MQSVNNWFSLFQWPCLWCRWNVQLSFNSNSFRSNKWKFQYFRQQTRLFCWLRVHSGGKENEWALIGKRAAWSGCEPTGSWIQWKLTARHQLRTRSAENGKLLAQQKWLRFLSFPFSLVSLNSHSIRRSHFLSSEFMWPLARFMNTLPSGVPQFGSCWQFYLKSKPSVEECGCR